MNTTYIEFSKAIHKGQVRTDGEPYFNHLKRVAISVNNFLNSRRIYGSKSAEMCAIAYLHDSIEDIEWVTEEVIEKKYGRKVAKGVMSLTRNRTQSYKDYIECIPPCLYLIKIMDICDNYFTARKSSQKRYRQAMRHLDPFEVFSKNGIPNSKQ